MRVTSKASAKDDGEPYGANGIDSNPRDLITIASLSLKKPNPFLFVPRRGAAAAMAEDIGAIGIKKLRFEGNIVSTGTSSWLLSGQLGATVIQECVVTLAPKKTRLDVAVVRDFSTEEGGEPTRTYQPVPELDIETVAGAINLAAVSREVLLLELPTYPKVEGAESNLLNFSDDSGLDSHGDGRRPFASLSELRNRLCG